MSYKAVVVNCEDCNKPFMVLVTQSAKVIKGKCQNCFQKDLQKYLTKQEKKEKV